MKGRIVMRARYRTADTNVVIELEGSVPGERVLQAKVGKETVLPAGFEEAMMEVGAASRARALADDEEAFAAVLAALEAKGFKFEPIAEQSVAMTMEVDFTTGRILSRSASVPAGAPINEGLADAMAAAVRRAMRELLVSQPLKLQEALDSGDGEAFLSALSHHRVIDSKDRDAVLSLVRTALARPEWGVHHAIIQVRAGLMASISGAASAGRTLLRQATDGGTLDGDSLAGARLAIGNSYAAEERYGAAAEIYRGVLDNTEGVHVENVAWAHHNLGSALVALGRIDEGVDRYRRAGELRASDGDSEQPYATLAKAASRVEHHNLHRALALYDEVGATIGETSERLRSLKGNVLLNAARVRCHDLDRFDEALRDLAAAKALLREFHEDAETLASAMKLEQFCHEAMGNVELAAQVTEEHTKFLADRPHLKVAQIENALKGETLPADQEISPAVRGRIKLMDGFSKLEALRGNEFIDKIESLVNETLQEDDDERPYISGVLLAYAGERLTRVGRTERALEYHLRAVAAHPASLDNRAKLGACLLNSGRLSEAAEVGLQLANANPGSHLGFLLCGLAAYKAADYASAEQMLGESLVRKAEHPVAREMLQKTKQEKLALALQGASFPSALVRTFSPTTHALFLDYLRGFTQRARLNADSFWKKRQEFKFVQNPENAGRALFAQDLTATCRATRIYRETTLPGGRIDLIANVLGTEFVTELKMCGEGYSRNWAEGGFDQLRQYMRERGATRGYLVVFDARASQADEDAIPPVVDLGDGMISFCTVVNIRGMDK